MDSEDLTNRPCRLCGAPYLWPLCPECVANDRRGSQKAKAARQCKQSFTKYRTWMDDDGVSHPASAHPLYTTWKHAKARCCNPGHERYADYGGRGIWMHAEWVADPVAFYEWVEKNLGPRRKGASLDRVDNDGNYEFDNLEWSDAKEQANNRRSSKSNRQEACEDCLYPRRCGDGLACALDALPWNASRAALERRRSMWPEGSPSWWDDPEDGLWGSILREE